jgi:hypothetical protein
MFVRRLFFTTGVFCFVMPLIATAAVEKPHAVSSLQLILPEKRTPVVDHIAKVFQQQIQKRCNAKVNDTAEAPLHVALSIEPGIGSEGFKISDESSGTIRIVGNDERGLLYGVGKFLHTSRYDQGVFTAGTWRGTSVPEKPVRGIYFATHFHNFYHDAPIEEVQQYIQELGLWGINAVSVWYDMRYFQGFDDPKAVEFRNRLRKILSAARDIGLNVGLLAIANEGYDNSPPELRADMSGMRGDSINADICPNKPGGREYILGNFAQLFTAFADLHPEYVWIWPYDSGGCGCEKCRPWGANGFLKMAEPLAKIAKKSFPGVKIIISTWSFTLEEWEGMGKAFSPRPSWADYILSEFFAKIGYDQSLICLKAGIDVPINLADTPGRLPMLGFPEISMQFIMPWGGYGVVTKPEAFEKEWRKRAPTLSGGFPYSEGIFEDISKALFVQFYWTPNRAADEILKEYAAFEYAPEAAEDVVRVLHIFEQNHFRNRIGPSAPKALKTLQAVEAKLSPQARSAWRWRILFLRGLIDAELFRTHGKVEGPVLRKAFAELTEIYHAQNANSILRPPQVP